MIFNRFYKKGQLCLWIILLIGFASCKVIQDAKESSILYDWELGVLVDKGLILETLNGKDVNIVQASEVAEPLGYRLVMRSQNEFYMDALRNRLLATGALQVSLIKRSY
ncbi:hypothetical protein [Pedobacter frigoris]|uniref:Uncharacterized protein n=1 Tax=Pedobacter frigoris TaxID=2571272 RepID=A0A4U1CD67_9SPHI|nr:hypothetical protein [Pedobacter frigoris]TKC04221.1 hypothetical protein FA047_16615 [Pedobacter frigoris]